MTEIVAVGLTEEELRTVSKLASDQGYSVDHLIPVELSTGRGQKFRLLGRIDAADLYVRIHHSRVAVLYGSSVFVRRVPSAQLRETGVVSISDFVRYKAFVKSVRDGDGKWLDALAEWCGLVDVATDSDPRCLPFQTFSAQADYELEVPEGRSRFRKDHQRPGGWWDSRALLWQTARPNVRHGREPIVIAGHQLSLGYHWDVQGSGRIHNSAVVYTFKGHINVYPDAGIRKGNHSREVHSRSASQVLDEQERRQGYRREGSQPASKRPRGRT